jgi:hypothetical protein
MDRPLPGGDEIAAKRTQKAGNGDVIDNENSAIRWAPTGSTRRLGPRQSIPNGSIVDKARSLTRGDACIVPIITSDGRPHQPKNLRGGLSLSFDRSACSGLRRARDG